MFLGSTACLFVSRDQTSNVADLLLKIMQILCSISSGKCSNYDHNLNVIIPIDIRALALLVMGVYLNLGLLDSWTSYTWSFHPQSDCKCTVTLVDPVM